MHISDCCQFSDIHISQGSVATYLKCGGIFKYEFVANLPMSLPVKEFWKSVNIWGSYGQQFSVLFFFETQCIMFMHWFLHWFLENFIFHFIITQWKSSKFILSESFILGFYWKCTIDSYAIRTYSLLEDSSVKCSASKFCSWACTACRRYGFSPGSIQGGPVKTAHQTHGHGSVKS